MFTFQWSLPKPGQNHRPASPSTGSTPQCYLHIYLSALRPDSAPAATVANLPDAASTPPNANNIKALEWHKIQSFARSFWGLVNVYRWGLQSSLFICQSQNSKVDNAHKNHQPTSFRINPSAVINQPVVSAQARTCSCCFCINLWMPSTWGSNYSTGGD
jgi:hypothetical protein